MKSSARKHWEEFRKKKLGRIPKKKLGRIPKRKNSKMYGLACLRTWTASSNLISDQFFPCTAGSDFLQGLSPHLFCLICRTKQKMTGRARRDSDPTVESGFHPSPSVRNATPTCRNRMLFTKPPNQDVTVYDSGRTFITCPSGCT